QRPSPPARDGPACQGQPNCGWLRSPMLAALILAAGESRRMGSPKALLPHQGRPFLQHLIDVTRHPRIGFTRVVLGANAEEIREQLTLDPTTVVVNPQWDQGQISSLQSALVGLPMGTTAGLLIALVDTPRIGT